MTNQYRLALAAGLVAAPQERTTVLRGRVGRGLRFHWDGAAVDPTTAATYMVEEELQGIYRPHIEWHLGRALLMQHAGHDVDGILWVCQREQARRLETIVGAWLDVQGAMPGLEPLHMQARAPSGALLWDLGPSLARRRVRRAHRGRWCARRCHRRPLGALFPFSPRAR